MSGFSQSTKALAQAVAAAKRAHDELKRDADDAAYEVKHAQQWLDRAAHKHMAEARIDASVFRAEVEAARMSLER